MARVNGWRSLTGIFAVRGFRTPKPHLRRLTLFWASVGLCCAQSTQGVLLGHISDSLTRQSLPTAEIVCTDLDTRQTYSTSVDGFGFYGISSLSPGNYAVTVTAAGYQTQQARALEIPVAGRVELNFRMRPFSDLWGAGQFKTWQMTGSQQTLGFYGPDVDTRRIAVFRANNGIMSALETSRSDVITPLAIDNLPLTGRDVYTMLLLLPGVTADTATARGLGYSVFGQRPSSSNYLLDGSDNNALLATGPLNTARPEFIQEYRVSTGTYSAEYGRTAGFVANAITRAASNSWHGTGFGYLENQRLNANGFQENAGGLPRNIFTQLESGFVVSGAFVPKRIFISAGIDYLHTTAAADPQPYALLASSFVESTDPASLSGSLLRAFPPAAALSGLGDTVPALLTPPAGFSRSGIYARLDFTPGSSRRIFARVMRDAFNKPEFLYSPYGGFSTPYFQTGLSLGAGWTERFGAAGLNDFHAMRAGDSIRVEAPNSNIPQLAVSLDRDIVQGGQRYALALPGPRNSYNYRNLGANYELTDTFTFVTGRNVWKAGGNFFQRSIDLNLGFNPGGYLLFNGLQNLRDGIPFELQVEVDRAIPGFKPASPARQYRYRQSYAFAQDSIRLTRRLTLDFGLRYEWYGSPYNTGSVGSGKDTLIELAGTGNIRSAIAGASSVTPGGTAPQVLFSAAGLNLAPRIGLAWDLLGTGKAVLRASYGIFYDRPFDNLWENVIQNRYQTVAFQDFQVPIPAGFDATRIEAAGTYVNSSQVVNGLLFQPSLRAPRIQNAFLGFQGTVGGGFSFEADAILSRGRALITTDIVNRPFSVPTTSDNLLGYLNPAFSLLDYRSNQGNSQYSALSGTLHFRHPTLAAQISYTWSHSLDGQSEPLANAFFNLNQLASQQNPASYFSAFTRQFDSNHDWGNSDFDQRHNLVFFGIWSPRAPSFRQRWLNAGLRRWTISGLAAARAGLPFSVYARQSTGIFSENIINERADVVNPANARISTSASGGRSLLDVSAFSLPAGIVGNSGRNAFTGPGLFSADTSIARTFSLPGRLEKASVTLRADAYNVLNHANLGNPNSRWSQGSTAFGKALFGRSEAASGFPLLVPLHESARIVQLMLRIEF